MANSIFLNLKSKSIIKIKREDIKKLYNLLFFLKSKYAYIFFLFLQIQRELYLLVEEQNKKLHEMITYQKRKNS